jgi:sugar phosphate isomerase/epimerase
MSVATARQSTVGVDVRTVANWDCWPESGDLLGSAAIDLLARTGASVVELALDEHHATAERLQAARTRALPALLEAGIEPHSLSTDLFWRYNLATQSADQRGHVLRVVRTLCRMAADYQAQTVIVLPGMQEPEVPYEATYAAAVQTLQIAAVYAMEHGVTLAVENAPTSFLQSPQEFSNLIRDVDSPVIRACINLSNVMTARQAYPQNWIAALSEGLVLVHAHIEDAVESAMTTGGDRLDWDTCLAALRATRYQGALILGPPPVSLAPATLAPSLDAVATGVRKVQSLCRQSN